jgi:cbb3-type cytochrome oxidase subunit 3
MFEMTWVFGIVLLGIVLFVFATRQRRLSAAQRKETDKIARDNWGKENVR